MLCEVLIFNTYGPRMRPDDGRVVPTFITQALRGNDLTVYDDGKQTRSFFYVDDLINGLVSLMRIEDLSLSVYNISKEKERTINQLAHEVLDIIETDSKIIHEPLPEDDPSQRCPDISRAKSDLDCMPTISLQEGLKMTIPHFKM